MKWFSVLMVAATIASTGCNYCGPEQHAITTSANALMMGGDIATRQIQYVTYRLTEPPATHDAFQFVFNTLEGSTGGEGVALTLSGTDAMTQEVVTIVLALPVSLRGEHANLSRRVVDWNDSRGGSDARARTAPVEP